MMPQMHQMMSQQQQVVETTPGQSLKTSETVNLTEKYERLTTRSQDATQ